MDTSEALDQRHVIWLLFYYPFFLAVNSFVCADVYYRLRTTKLDDQTHPFSQLVTNHGQKDNNRASHGTNSIPDTRESDDVPELSIPTSADIDSDSVLVDPEDHDAQEKDNRGSRLTANVALTSSLKSDTNAETSYPTTVVDVTDETLRKRGSNEKQLLHLVLLAVVVSTLTLYLFHSFAIWAVRYARESPLMKLISGMWMLMCSAIVLCPISRLQDTLYVPEVSSDKEDESRDEAADDAEGEQSVLRAKTEDRIEQRSLHTGKKRSVRSHFEEVPLLSDKRRLSPRTASIVGVLEWIYLVGIPSFVVPWVRLFFV